MKKTILMMVAGVACAASHGATIDRVLLRQNWPWSNRVRVDYVITDVTEPVDVTATFSLGSTPLAMSAVKGNVVGDLFAITTAGEKSFSFDPKVVFPNVTAKRLQNLCVQLTAAPTAYPKAAEVLYKIVNLDQSPMTITDVTRAEILNGKYGTYETDYGKIGEGYATSIPADEVLIWTGVTNDIAYKTDKLVLRKIPSGGATFTMGAAGFKSGALDPFCGEVTLTHDFWMAVFEMTVAQVRHLKPAYTPWETNLVHFANGTRAADYLSWSGARGSKGKTWPEGDHSNVDTGSIIGLLQAATGNKRFDLATEAQWEFAARGGTTTRYPSGKADSSYYEFAYPYKSSTQDPYLKGKDGYVPSQEEINLAKDGYPTRACSIEFGASVVGQRRPNAYGLYDMLGNVMEWVNGRCNWNATEGFFGTDPRGPTEFQDLGGGNVGMSIRGGSYQWTFTTGVYMRGGYITWYQLWDHGIRLCLHEED